jgi:hypothetical protein
MAISIGVLLGLIVALHCGFSAAVVGIPSQLTPITSLANISAPPPYWGVKHCYPEAITGTELSGKRIAFLLANGSDSYTTALAYSFVVSRGATVQMWCPLCPVGAGLSECSSILMNYYVPTYLATCTSATPSWDQVDVLIVPNGYEAVEPLRISATVQQSLRSFVATEGFGSRSLLVLGGSTEVLIDSGILMLLGNVTLPTTTDSMKDEIETNRNVTARANSSVTEAFLPLPQYNNGQNSVVLAKNASYFLSCLLRIAENLGESSSSLQGCNGAVAVTTQYSSVFSNVSEEYFRVLQATLDTNAPIVDISPSIMYTQCRNTNDVNFCDGWPFAVVAAHGTHDVEVISALNALSQNGGLSFLVCSEKGTTPDGYVYLGPTPALAPTYRAKCDHMISEFAYTELPMQGTTVVPGGTLATHGPLRNDINLWYCLGHSGTYSLYASALILLTVEDIKENITTVPSCDITDLDLRNRGFFPSQSNPVLYMRNPELQRAKVLAGCESAEMSLFELFINKTVEGLVWESEVQHKHDSIIGILFLTAALAIIVTVIVVTCIRNKRLARKAQYQRLQTHPGVEVERSEHEFKDTSIYE